MARNPVAINDGGMFRFTDFMTYVPDFLKEEDDVVSLMQLFSDYINNAYRNTEVSKKFYFNFTASGSILGHIKERTQDFIEKMRKSAENNLYVYFMSLPRTNANTNSVTKLNYINAPIVYDGKYSDELQLSILINKLKEYNSAGDSVVNDGDVIYIKYSDGSIYPYYVNKDTGTLVIDKMNSSQDPFHDTVNYNINGAPRIVKFIPKDVGEMLVTTVGEIDGVDIYNIRFELSIDDLQSTSSHFIVNNGDDYVEVDYFSYLKSRQINYDYYVSLSMDGNSGPFRWVNGSPRGIFYFKGLRDFANGGDLDIYREWRIVKVNVLSNGTTCYATLNSTCDLQTGDKFYIRSDEVIGIIASTLKQYKLNGEFTVISAVGNVISFTLKQDGSTVQLTSSVEKYMTEYNRLFVYGLYYSRLTYDTNDYTVKIQWDNSLGEVDVHEGSILYAYDSVDNTSLGYLAPLQNGDPYIVFPDEIAVSVGDVIYFEVVDNGIVNEIKTEWLEDNEDIFYEPLKVMDKRGNRVLLKDIAVDSGVKFDISSVPTGTDDETREKIRVANNALSICVKKVTAGLGTLYTPTDEDNDAIVYGADRIPAVDDVCLIGEMEIDESYISTITYKDDIYTVVDVKEVGTNKYLVTFDGDITIDYDNSKLSVKYLDKPEEEPYAIIGNFVSNTFAECYSHSGDIYTHDYWIDEDVEYILRCAYKDEIGNKISFREYSPYESYSIGDYIYYSDGLIYKAIDNVSPINETYRDNPISSGKFIPYMYNVATMNTVTVNNEYMYGLYSISTLQYGDKIDLTEYEKYNEILNKIFIEKGDDNSLYYTWKDRDYLLNQNEYSSSGKHRTGFAEFYTTDDEHDIVTDTAESYSVATSVPNTGIIMKGLNNQTSFNYKKYMVATRIGVGKYKFTISYPSHCLPDKSLIRISGAGSVGVFDFDTPDNEFDKITVVNTDEFYFTRNVDYDVDEVVNTTLSTVVTYYRSIYNPITEMEYYYKDYLSYKEGYLYVTTEYPHGYSTYTKVTIENAPSGNTSSSGWISNIVKDKRVDIIVDEYTYAISIHQVYAPTPASSEEILLSYGGTGNSYTDNSYSVVSPEEGDCIKINKTYYKVTKLDWEELSGDTLYTPCVFYSHQNLMDITDTNPQSAFSDEIRIDTITFNGYDTVTVTTKAPMNLVAGKSSVYISYVYPLSYCGRFIVDEVISTRRFTYKVVPYSINIDEGTHINDGYMRCHEACMFKYTIYDIMFSRKSKYDLYRYANQIVDDMESVSSINNLIVTVGAHGYSEGDKIVLNVGDVYENAVVDTVIDKVSFTYKGIAPSDFSGGYVFKGVYITAGDHSDNVVTSGTYSQKLNCLSKTAAFDDGVYEFKEGDIVFANDQLYTDTPKVYCVTDKLWNICSARRIIKIKDMDVDKYHNAEWDDATVLDNIDEYKYKVYSYAEVVDDTLKNAEEGISSYICPWHIRNFNFSMPMIEHFDTTEKVDYQFNSKHDYASVAPRYDFEDTSFQGIPDMKYPLIEKIERLIYLRDANVIDYDLIGYLARFMGYDITDAKRNIDESVMYGTNEQKIAAVRETVSNLPQYYSLGGTRSGLEMLLTTFGVIADVITMWTDLNNPYKELIEEGSLRYRTDSDYENGIISQWAPTPHVNVRLSAVDNFKTSFSNEDEFNTLIKNIKTFKPIQVVFDEFIKYVKTENGKITMRNVTFVNKGKMNIDLNYEIYSFEDIDICGEKK